MKALEILKNYFTQNNGSCMTVGVSKEYLDEAIKELEALENRSCDGCKHYLSENGNYPLNPCSECSRWYPDSWEQK